MKRIVLTVILALVALSASAQTLVVYYSRTGQNYTSDGIVNLKAGNTAVVAKQIQKLTGADIFQLETVRQYAADYHECTQEAKQELAAGARPALKADIDISKYDTIYLGWPCWWGSPAAPWARCSITPSPWPPGFGRATPGSSICCLWRGC